MFASKAGAYMSEAPFKRSTLQQATGLALKHYIRLEKTTRDKHSSLLGPFISYKSFQKYDIQFAYNSWYFF
jgi:hypothetical protein